MTCKECSELLSQYIDKELSGKEIREINNHLQSCPSCRKEYDLLCSTIDCVCQLECVEPPEDFHERLMCKIYKECAPLRRTIRPFWGSLAFGSLAAAAILLVVIIYNPFDMQTNLPKMKVAGKSINPAQQKSEITRQEQPWEDFYKKQQSQGTQKALVPMKSASAVSKGNSLIKPISHGISVSSRSIHKKASASKSLYCQNREWSGEDSKISVKKSYAVRNHNEALTLWKEAGITPLPLSKMEWNKNQLIALFIGEKPGQGYEIQLKRIEEKNNQLNIFYHVNPPAVLSPKKISKPFLVFELKKSGLPVELIEE